jgi:hypothetical protein
MDGFPENWMPPRELAGGLPRKKHLTPRGVFAFIFALALTPGAVFAFTAFHMAQRQSGDTNDNLRLHGQDATARIIRLWHTKGRGSSEVVTYVFSAGGKRVQGDCDVPLRVWDSMRIGADLPVRYVPSDPAVNHPSAWEESTVPMWVAIGLPSIPAAISLCLLIVVMRRGQLAAYGVPAPGIVSLSYQMKTGWGVRYRFRTAEGAVVSGRDQSDRGYEAGAHVCVLYMPRHPNRNSLYPLTLYRVE